MFGRSRHKGKPQIDLSSKNDLMVKVFQGNLGEGDIS